jgi:glycerol uptake operon antiterminator
VDSGFARVLKDKPIIAAVRDLADLNEACGAPVGVIFLLGGTISDLKSAVRVARENDKLILLHLDLIAGLGKDEAALEFLTTEVQPTGLITTRTNLIQRMRRLGLLSVQRLFLLDSLSLTTGIEAVRSSKADVVEVLPGLIPKAIATIRQQVAGPVIAGGLISTRQEVIQALNAGATGVSVSNKRLWKTAQ